ncbi:MAG: hypothetical protein K6L75_02685 [Cellvibrionaceae bacterium]
MFKKYHSKIAYAFLLSLLLGTSFSAHSYRQIECQGDGFKEKVRWKLPRSNGIMNINFTSHLTGKHVGSLYRATSAINQGPAAVKTLIYPLRTPNQNADIFRRESLSRNGRNDIYFYNVTFRTDPKSNMQVVDTKRAATTWLQYDCKKGNARIKEADIGLNIFAEILARGPVLYGYPDDSLKDLAVKSIYWPETIGHEMGHALGLAHTENTYSAMGVGAHHFIHNGKTPYFYFGEDASNGLIGLYQRKNKNMEDLGVTTFRFSKKIDSGQEAPNKYYARSEPIRLEEGIFFRTPDGLEGSYMYSDATQVKIAFGLENNGENKHRARVKYYFSQDKTINSNDTLLKTMYYTLGRNTVYYPKETLQLPSWFKSNRTYYLGAVIDTNNIVSEFEKKNNTAVIPIHRLSYLTR